MRVVDAGVVVDLLAGGLAPEALGEEELAAPHLIDSEVTSVLRRLVLHGKLNSQQGEAAFEGFLDLVLTRFPADRLRPRICSCATTSPATTPPTWPWRRRWGRRRC